MSAMVLSFVIVISAMRSVPACLRRFAADADPLAVVKVLLLDDERVADVEARGDFNPAINSRQPERDRLVDGDAAAAVGNVGRGFGAVAMNQVRWGEDRLRRRRRSCRS